MDAKLTSAGQQVWWWRGYNKVRGACPNGLQESSGSAIRGSKQRKGKQ